MSEEYFDPGSNCARCPDPLNSHSLLMTAIEVTVTCEVDGCDCKYGWALGRRLETGPFNPEAAEALGDLPIREGEPRE